MLASSDDGLSYDAKILSGSSCDPLQYDFHESVLWEGTFEQEYVLSCQK